jgi:hypothetical protein
MISPLVFPAALGAVTLTAAAVLAHKAFLQSARLAFLAPGYPVWWYGLTWRRKAAVAVTLPAAGAITGLGWEAAPLPAVAAIVTLTAATAASRVIRATARQGR